MTTGVRRIGAERILLVARRRRFVHLLVVLRCSLVQEMGPARCHFESTADLLTEIMYIPRPYTAQPMRHITKFRLAIKLILMTTYSLCITFLLSFVSPRFSFVHV